MSKRPWKYPREIDFDSTKIETEPSGFKSLDEFMVFKKNTYELITLAALPGVGKSQLALQIAGFVSVKKEVLYFSTEMSANILTARLCAARYSIPLKSILTRDLAENQVRFEDAQLDLDLLKLGIVDDFPKSIDSVYKICDQAQGLGLIVIDQMPQFVESFEGYEGINRLTASFKTLAQKKKCPVLMVAQLNRSMQNRRRSDESTQRPMYSDLKGSSSIEQDSDIVMFLTADRDVNPNTTHVHIVKNKNGRTGDFNLQWLSTFVQFNDFQGDLFR